jgi:CRP/FNR family transcriptional regulator
MRTAARTAQVGELPDQRAVDTAMGLSVLGRLPAPVRTRLLIGSVLAQIPAGGGLHRQGREPWTALVVEGVVRVYIESDDGRQATVRYAREGAVLGLAATLGGRVPANVHAVTDAVLLRLDADVLQQACSTDAAAAWTLAVDLAQAICETVHELAESDFASVQQRVVRHLLDLSERRQEPGTETCALVALVTQQQLADAAGTVREVVARTLQTLRREGLVTTVPGGIRLDDPAGLHRRTWAAHGG